MKKLGLLALLLIATTGCQGGLLSRLFHGEPCRGCGVGLPPAPAVAAPCNGCPTNSSLYGSYDGIVADGYYGGEVVDGNTYYGGIIDGGSIITDPNAVGQPTQPIPAT